MVRKNVAEILTNHVTFELEAIDRMYLNAYVPSLQLGRPGSSAALAIPRGR